MSTISEEEISNALVVINEKLGWLASNGVDVSVGEVTEHPFPAYNPCAGGEKLPPTVTNAIKKVFEFFAPATSCRCCCGARVLLAVVVAVVAIAAAVLK